MSARSTPKPRTRYVRRLRQPSALGSLSHFPQVRPVHWPDDEPHSPWRPHWRRHSSRTDRRRPGRTGAIQTRPGRHGAGRVRRRHRATGRRCRSRAAVVSPGDRSSSTPTASRATRSPRARSLRTIPPTKRTRSGCASSTENFWQSGSPIAVLRAAVSVDPRDENRPGGRSQSNREGHPKLRGHSCLLLFVP
jgi:hypothetical protein